MKSIKRLLCVILVTLSSAASAAPMTFLITGTGAASLAGNGISSAFELRLVGDTSAIVVSPSTSSANEITTLSSAVLTFAGNAPLTFDTSKRAGFNFGNNTFFFGEPDSAGGSDLFNFRPPAAPAYTFGDPYGPVPVTNIFLSQFNGVATSGGPLSFTSASDVVFTAFFGQGNPTVVPLPGTAALLMGGMLLLAPLARRARRN